MAYRLAKAVLALDKEMGDTSVDSLVEIAKAMEQR